VAAKPAAAPLSEARQFVEKARKLYEPWDLASREDLDLAEELLKKAVTLDPTDGEAWAHSALLSCLKLVISFDTSDERRLAVRVQGDRALKFAPDSDFVRFAHAFSLRFNPQTQDECLRLLREEAARQPNNKLVVRTLGNTLRNFGDLEQSLIYLAKAAAIPGRDPVTIFNRAQTLQAMGRFAEAEAAVDEALAMVPTYPNASRAKLLLLLDYHEDLARARGVSRQATTGVFAR